MSEHCAAAHEDVAVDHTIYDDQHHVPKHPLSMKSRRTLAAKGHYDDAPSGSEQRSDGIDMDIDGIEDG